MENYAVTATSHTPEITLDVEAGTLALVGESYPEDVSAFYAPLLSQLDAYIATKPAQGLRVDLKFIYINSSSARTIMQLLKKFDDAAEDGLQVTVRWIYDEDDDMMMEMGEEYGEDLESVDFELVESHNA